LGGDLDNYVVAIASVDDPAVRGRHWAIYADTKPILMGHETSNIGATIEALEQIRVSS
jgi:hypothetical protein